MTNWQIVYLARGKRLTSKPTLTYLTIEHKLQNVPEQCAHRRLQSSHVLRSQNMHVTRKPHLEWRQLWHLKVSAICKLLFCAVCSFLSRRDPSCISSRVLAARIQEKTIKINKLSSWITSAFFQTKGVNADTYRKHCPYCLPFRSEKHLHGS